MGKLFLVVVVLALCVADYGKGQEEAGVIGRPALVPALFVFGDSLIDNGNNNDLASFAKANYFPYGIDFSAGPTGRFSNGYTMVDTVAELLGLPLIPPFSEARASGDGMRYGVNFASAAAGILDNTGGNFVGRIPFGQQIKNFENSLDQLSNILGAADLSQGLANSIFFIGMGSNDYLNNYLMPNYDTKNHYNGQQYADLLTTQYTQHLTRLYNLGARKFAIAGLGAMGCIPSILAQSDSGVCSDEVNELIRPFNTNTKMMVNRLNANLPGSRFTFIDIGNMFQDLLVNAESYGFAVVNRGCCGLGRNSGQVTCLPMQAPCPDRSRYVFWDAYHPTEAVNVLLGQKAFSGGSESAHPFNIQQLANM